MVKVFSRSGERDTWRLDPTRSVAEAMAERAARLTTGWTGDDIAEFSAGDEVVWKLWHATLYNYSRLYDHESGLDSLVLTPSRRARTKVWTSDHLRAFIGSMRDAIHDLFDEETMKEGARYIVRPGRAKPVRLYRVQLYVPHVNGAMKGR